MTSFVDDAVDDNSSNDDGGSASISTLISAMFVPLLVLAALNVFFAIIGVSVGFTRLYVNALLLLFEVSRCICVPPGGGRLRLPF
jgi:hypothetical protein